MDNSWREGGKRGTERERGGGGAREGEEEEGRMSGDEN